MKIKKVKQSQSPIENATTSTFSLTALFDAASNQSAIASFDEIIRNNIYTPLTLNHQILTYFYKTHGVIQTAIEIPVLDALRNGVEITSGELDADDIHTLLDLAESTNVFEMLGNAMKWARLYGGGALIINTDQDPETPLSMRQLKNLEFYDANRWELFNQTGWNPEMPEKLISFAPPKADYFWFYGKKVHKSRVIVLSGKSAPHTVRWNLAGWGMSEVERMIIDFNKYLRTNEVLYELLREAKIDVLKFESFKSSMATNAGAAKMSELITKVNQLKNFSNALILDKNDEFEQKQITFSGLAEVMKENRIGIASALRIPMTKLFGLSASGFSSGEEDIENYNAMVESEVRTKLRSPINKILKLLCLAAFGNDEMDVHFTYPPLRVLGAVEEETIRTSKQNRFMSLYNSGLITSYELGQILEKEKLLPISTAMANGLIEDHPEIPGLAGKQDAEDGEKGEKEKPKKDGD